jgi:hypothetical protein
MGRKDLASFTSAVSSSIIFCLAFCLLARWKRNAKNPVMRLRRTEMLRIIIVAVSRIEMDCDLFIVNAKGGTLIGAGSCLEMMEVIGAIE